MIETLKRPAPPTPGTPTRRPSRTFAHVAELGRNYLQAIREPRPRERLRLNALAWQDLDPALRAPQQALGRSYVGCGATHGVMEPCNFACTSCYLSAVANATPPLDFAAVRAQLDSLRDFLGPAGKCQITSGEVTLLAPEKLGRIVAYAKRIGLDPMVMTNGEAAVTNFGSTCHAICRVQPLPTTLSPAPLRNHATTRLPANRSALGRPRRTAPIPGKTREPTEDLPAGG